MITFETKLFFENVGKISTAMGRTILKYIWSSCCSFAEKRTTLKKIISLTSQSI